MIAILSKIQISPETVVDAPPAAPRGRVNIRGAALIALMAIGGALMGLGLPLGWIWLASQLETGPSPTLGPYVLVLVGLPISAAVLGKGLAQLDRLYARVTGYDPNNRPMHMSWMKSMRGERDSSHRHTVLDVVMMISVAAVWLAFGIWMLTFPHTTPLA
jgi:hypothetical protein